MRETFAVGRVDPRSREVVWLRRRRRPAFPGPWQVRAVVGPTGSSGGQDREPSREAPGAAELPEAPPTPTGAPPPPPGGDGARPQLDLFG